MADEAVLAVQQWLNTTYGSVSGFEKAPENGQTGWPTIYSLRMGLQHELGITGLSEAFGPATRAALDPIVDSLVLNYSTKKNITKLIKGAFWCKGISPGDFTDTFDASLVAAFEELQSDAGLTANGKVTTNLMAALFDMSAFVLVSGGKEKVRTMQQWLNSQYSSDLGVLPCDGIYQRDTNLALIYALQVALGIDTPNGTFGAQTDAALQGVSLSTGSTGEIVRIVEYGLYLNGYYDGDIGTTYTAAIGTAVQSFRSFMKYDNASTTAGYTAIKGLITSNGDTNRNSTAMDCATQLTATDVSNMRVAKFDYAGRYLTGTVGVGADEKDKSLTSSELNAIIDGGMKVFPIYEDGGYEEEYFTAAQGSKDGKLATLAALKLGLPADTVIYFAVDVDIQEGDIAGTVIPYLEAVQANLATSIYTPGVYGTRNVCLHAQDDLGYGYSFVADMSYGWSGNMGYRMPENWAFDQFTGYNSYNVDIDQDASSDRDTGVSKTSSTGSSADFFTLFKKVEAEAKAYTGLSNSLTVLQYICQFYRQFSYNDPEWALVTGPLDSVWLSRVNEAMGGITSTNQFGTLIDSATGQSVDIPHMFAPLETLIAYGNSPFTSGIADLAGWCGDLITSIADAHNTVSEYSSFYDSIYHHIGKLSSFGPEDLMADADALNLYANFYNSPSTSASEMISEYYTGSQNEVRYNSFLNNRFEGDSSTALTEVKKLLLGDSSLGVEYIAALEAVIKLKAKYTFTDSEASDAAKAFVTILDYLS